MEKPLLNSYIEFRTILTDHLYPTVKKNAYDAMMRKKCRNLLRVVFVELTGGCCCCVSWCFLLFVDACCCLFVAVVVVDGVVLLLWLLWLLLLLFVVVCCCGGDGVFGDCKQFWCCTLDHKAKSEIGLMGDLPPI